MTHYSPARTLLAALRPLCIALLVSSGLCGCARSASGPAASPTPTDWSGARTAQAQRKPGSTFRAAWDWVSEGPGQASIRIRVTPTRTGRTLHIRMPETAGVQLVGGERTGSHDAPVAGVELTHELRVTYDPNGFRHLLIEVDHDVSDARRSGQALLVRDPAATPTRPPETPGRRLTAGGHETKDIDGALKRR